MPETVRVCNRNSRHPPPKNIFILFGTPNPPSVTLRFVIEAGIIQGRRIGAAELEQVRQMLADHPDWSRRRISEQLATLWNWRNGAGQLKDMAARQMPIIQTLRALLPLTLSECSQDRKAAAGQRALFNALLHQHHYLSHHSTVGENLQYLVSDIRGRPLACVLFGASAWQCQARDQHIGWDASTRQRRLGYVTNNTRFLILPWVCVPQLASHVLGRIARRLSQDWQHKYGHPIHLLETFVDTSRFQGTCYQAANWIHVGQTTGRTRQNKSMILQSPPKAVWLYPLRPDYRQALCAS